MGGLMGPMAFDAAAQKAKRDIQDALGSYRRMPQAPQPRAQAQVMPNGMQMSAQVPMGQNQMQFGMQTQGMRPQDLMARYTTPNQSFGVNYQPQNKGVTATYARRFQEGGLATSLRHNPDDYQHDEEFVAATNQHMRDMVGKPRAMGGLAMAEGGGGAWTRKEGKNPEGGLNAKGRASLRAQGHDIKPPVSAKQAKKSPKAAARRKSFCARMSGMPGPMKDEKGRPTRKALSLRKWDC